MKISLAVSIVFMTATAMAVAAPKMQPLREDSGWQSVTLRRAWGPCGPKGNCADTYVVTRGNDRIEVNLEGCKSSLPLAEADKSTIRSIVEKKTFERDLGTEGSCGATPTDSFQSIRVTSRDGSQFQLMITGCSADTDAGRLRDVLSKYSELARANSHADVRSCAE